MHKVSRTYIKNKLSRKTNSYLVETLRLAMKNSHWSPISHILSVPSRKQSALNLGQIDKAVKDGDSILIPGKVLSQGELTKKIKICALSFSKSAMEKIKKSKSEAVYIIDEIKRNSKAEGLKLLR